MLSGHGSGGGHTHREGGRRKELFTKQGKGIPGGSEDGNKGKAINYGTRKTEKLKTRKKGDHTHTHTFGATTN